MDDEPPTATELDRLRRVANFQFGRGGAEALFGAAAGAGAGTDGEDGPGGNDGLGGNDAPDGDGTDSDDADGDDGPSARRDPPRDADTDAVDGLTVTRTSSGRVEQCFDDGERLFTKETNGRYVLSVAGGRRIVAGLEAPRHRVTVGEESVEFVREGRNAFAKFVRSVDPDLRPGDEAVVVHDGTVLGVGRAELSPRGMADFDTGVAVFVRHGAGD